MFVSKDDSINKANVQYLERQSIDLATDCSQYGVMNEQQGKEISLSNYQRDIMDEFFDDGHIKLLAFKGDLALIRSSDSLIIGTPR